MTQSADTDKTILDAIDKLDHKIDTFNEKFDNYQKASQSLVNLAFGLIASATIVTSIEIDVKSSDSHPDRRHRFRVRGRR
jgi:hypothetical protein